jgi:hypothetical protein
VVHELAEEHGNVAAVPDLGQIEWPRPAGLLEDFPTGSVLGLSPGSIPPPVGHQNRSPPSPMYLNKSSRCPSSIRRTRTAYRTTAPSAAAVGHGVVSIDA